LGVASRFGVGIFLLDLDAAHEVYEAARQEHAGAA
jgi:hypothetical protein